MNVSSVIKLKKEHSKKKFLRKVAIYLAKEEETPTDILESSFSNVKEEEKEYLIVSGKTNVNYTCSVGYDRQETYYEKERRYDSRIDDYRYVNVEKTRTVTDWHPYSGSNTSNEVTIVGNASSQDNYRSYSEVSDCYRSCKEENREEVDNNMTVNSNAYAQAESNCICSCFYSVDLPGDRQKDKNYSGEVDVEDVNGLLVPEYSMTYDYQGKKYTAKGFAAGKMQINADYPNISSDVAKEAKEAVKHFKFLAIGSLILGIILHILSVWSWIGYLCFVGYGAAITFLFLYIKKGNAKKESIYAFRQEEKKKDLIAFLQKNEMKPLTEAEISSFSKK